MSARQEIGRLSLSAPFRRIFGTRTPAYLGAIEGSIWLVLAEDPDEALLAVMGGAGQEIAPAMPDAEIFAIPSLERICRGLLEERELEAAGRCRCGRPLVGISEHVLVHADGEKVARSCALERKANL